jgi:hypothetical protein
MLTSILSILGQNTWSTTPLPASFWGSVTSDSSGKYLAAGQYVNYTSNPQQGLIYYSLDGGNSWNASNTPVGDYIWLTSDDSGQYKAACSAEQVFLSTDYGVTWTENANSPVCRSIASDASGQRLVASQYATTASGNIAISTDGGASWTSSLGPSGTGVVACDSFGVNMLYAVAYQGVYVSVNGGLQWTSTPLSDSTNWQTVAVSSTGNAMYAASSFSDPSSVYKSVDFGVSWTAISQLTGIYYSAIDKSGMKLVVTGYNGAYITEDGGSSAFTSLDAPSGLDLNGVAGDSNLTSLVCIGKYQGQSVSSSEVYLYRSAAGTAHYAILTCVQV